MENFVLYDEICNVDGQAIHKARRKGTITFLAISCIEKKRRTYATNHVRFAHGFNHQNILHFHEWYETSNHLWLVMDLCTGGTLERMLQEDKCFPESAIINIARQLIHGLYFIQSTGIVFADWSPNRIFLDGCGNVKYFDFSYARLEHETSADIFHREDGSGPVFDGLSGASLPYIAPEILAGDPASKSSDVWGLGCILFKMFFGVTPFATQVPSHLIQMIRNNKLEIPVQCCRQPSGDLWQLINAMLIKDPRKRITLKDLMAHSYWQVNPPTDDALYNNPVDEETASMTTSVITVVTAAAAGNHALQAPRVNDSKTHRDEGACMKRSKPIGDAAMNTDNESQPKQKAVVWKTAIGQTPKPYAQPSSDKLHEAPVGEANFTLHAQAYPVAMRRKTTEPPSDLHNKTPNTSSDGSVDTSSRCDSKLSYTNDSGQNTIYESQDSLNPACSPFSMDGRMTRSEFTFRDSDASSQPASSGLRRSPWSSKAAALVSPQTRARIALIYPWGDDGQFLPRDTRFSEPQTLREWVDLLSSDEIEDLGNVRCTTDGENAVKQRVSPSWLPRPLNEYDKWIKNPPQAEVRLPGGITPLTPTELGAISPEDIQAHSDYLLDVIKTLGSPQKPRSKPSSIPYYIAWFLSATALTHTKGDSKKPKFEEKLGASVLRAKSFLAQTALLFKQNTLTNDNRAWLCRIVGLLAFRASFMIRYYAEDPHNQTHLYNLVNEIGPEIPTLLSAIVEILREPVSKTVLLLKQAAIIALGELLVCEASMCGRVLAEPEKYDHLSCMGLSVPKIQWQSAVLQIIRSLAPTTLARGPTAVQPQSSTPSVFCSIPKKPNERDDSLASLVRLSEEHVRLAAARTLDEVIIAVVGCKLSRLLQNMDFDEMDRDRPDVQLAFALSSSVNALLECLLTPENMSRVWADGMMGGGGVESKASGVSCPNILIHQLVHASSSALAGLVRLRPALFTGGLIDRNGAKAVIQKLNPSVRTRETKSTAIMAHLLSATATGILLPLSFRGRSLGRSFLRTGLKSGTPAACRRLLQAPSFIASLTHHFESPHVMLRAKAYLVAAAALESAEVLVATCDARLPSCLERDLRMTNQHYKPIKNSLDEDGVIIGGEEDVEENGRVGASSTTVAAAAPGLQYLGICVKHLADVIVHNLVPYICKQVAISIGAHSAVGANAPKSAAPLNPLKPSSVMTASTYQERSKQRNVSSAGNARRSPLNGGAVGRTNGSSRNRLLLAAGGVASPSNASGVSLKTWLPAFSCIPGILASSASIRNSLLLPPSTSEVDTESDRFCLIDFLGKIFSHWASSDPASGLSSVSGVHQTGSLEHQLLGLSLTLIEDMSQRVDVVEGRRADLIKTVLPALAQLAVAPASDPITRTICVKIILGMKNVWCGGASEDEGLGISMTTSTISLQNIPRTPNSVVNNGLSSLTRSPLSSDRVNLVHGGPSTPSRVSSINRTASMQEKNSAMRRPSSSVSTRSNPRLNSVLEGRPMSVYGYRSASNVVRCKITPNARGPIQGPSPDVLRGVVDIVSNLLTPYASLLLDPCDPSPSPYFLRILIDCLFLLQPPSRSSCRVHTSPPTLVRVNSDLPVSIIRLLAGAIGDASSESGSHRFSTHCLLSLRLLHTLLSHWPRETRLLELILKTSEKRQSLIVVVSALVVSIGGSILRRGRRDSQSNCLAPAPAPASSSAAYTSSCSAAIRSKARSATPQPTSSRRGSTSQAPASLQLLKVTSETPGLAHLFAALDLLNLVLDFIADVVRCALQCRQEGKSSRPSSARSRKPNTIDISEMLPSVPEEICVLAEQLLATARPPNHLPGILASLLEASPTSPTDSSADPPSASSLYHADSLVACDLVSCATSALANLASLYGGEYCRTALSAAGLRGFAVAIRRSSIAEATAAAASSSSSSTPTHAETRTGTRMLLRILRRLSDSDEVCSHRITGPAAKPLQSAIWKLRAAGCDGGEENQDGATVRLADALLDRLTNNSSGTRRPDAVAI